MHALLSTPHTWVSGLDLLAPTQSGGGPGWWASLAWVGVIACVLGVMAFTFLVVCVCVASALSIALSIVIVVVNTLRRSLAWRRSTPVTQE